MGENKDADQLRGNREADQRLCFRYTDSSVRRPVIDQGPVIDQLVVIGYKFSKDT